MYTSHPPFQFIFSEEDYQGNLWLDTDKFNNIEFITHQISPLHYEVFPSLQNFKIFDNFGNFIILDTNGHELICQLFKSVKIAIIYGSGEAIKKQDMNELKFTYASLI